MLRRRAPQHLAALIALTFPCRSIASNTTALPGRHAHWVLRTTNLEKSLEFYKKVMGMQVLRHEENAKACEITCNGNYNTAWSKTMVGYATEDRAYALELTYNYGIESYKPGEALRAIALRPRIALKGALKVAKDLGYSSVPISEFGVKSGDITLGFGPPHDFKDEQGGAVVIKGPDDYKYLLLPIHTEAHLGFSEPFDHIRLRVRNPSVSVDFYCGLLGMVEQPTPVGKLVGYWPHRPDSIPIFLEENPTGGTVRVEQWEGRHAVTLPADDLRAVYNRVLKERPDLVVHKLKELNDNLGKLLIAILKDPDGLEICLVSGETFDRAALAATDYREPDWTRRLQSTPIFGKKTDL